MKTAFITGVTSGIGEACTRQFVADGWRVIGTGRRVDRLNALADELGEVFTPITLDMCDRAYLLESGALTLEGTGGELIDDPRMRKAYLGG